MSSTLLQLSLLQFFAVVYRTTVQKYGIEPIPSKLEPPFWLLHLKLCFSSFFLEAYIRVSY